MRTWRNWNLAGGNRKWCSHFEKCLAVSQIKCRITKCPSNSSPRYRPDRNKCMCSHIDIQNLYVNVYSSQIDKKWKQSNVYQVMNGKINVVKLHTKYYSVIKKDEILIHFTTWMKCKNIMLNERNQTQRPHISCAVKANLEREKIN